MSTRVVHDADIYLAGAVALSAGVIALGFSIAGRLTNPEVRQTDESKEDVAALKEKRKPEFRKFVK